MHTRWPDYCMQCENTSSNKLSELLLEISKLIFEKQLYCIDHDLGKELMHNMLVLRCEDACAYGPTDAIFSIA